MRLLSLSLFIASAFNADLGRTPKFFFIFVGYYPTSFIPPSVTHPPFSFPNPLTLTTKKIK